MPANHFSHLSRDQIHKLVRANSSSKITEKAILEFAHHYCVLSPSTRSARKITQKMKEQASYQTVLKWYRLVTSADEKAAGALHSTKETKAETDYLSGKDPAHRETNKRGLRKRTTDPMTRAEMWADLDEMMREAKENNDLKLYLECLDRRAKITPGITAPDTKLNINLETVLGPKGLDSIDSQLQSQIAALSEMGELPPAFKKALLSPANAQLSEPPPDLLEGPDEE